MEYGNDELMHYGIKGQHWGVRRYRNYDGSYTQAGLKRYDKSLAERNARATRYNEASNKYGKKSAEATNARLAYKKAKRKNIKDYKHLKQDKLGDQGKDLYSRGYTITGANETARLLQQVGGYGMLAASYFMAKGDQHTGEQLAGASLTLLGAVKLSTLPQVYRNKRLRAYYSHTSNY